MDNVVNYQNYEILSDVLSDQNLRQKIRLLCVFGCGAGEVIFATNDDYVYGFGRNRFGGLGVGTNEEHLFKTPILNISLSGKNISNFYCGFEHWIALTASGRCYSWGHNEFGQLGIGTVESSPTPQLIKALSHKKVVDISCGAFYNLVLTSDGQVYGWGHNQLGQLGDGTYQSVTIPKLISFNEEIASLSCGIKHSLALTITGRVYVWGLNSYGQLGREIRRPAHINTPQMIPGFEDKVFAKAVCGPNHSLVLTIDGYVYAFGDNKGGQIGNGEMDSQNTPFKVSSYIKFKDIIAHKENDISIGVSIDNKYYVWGLANNRRYLRPKEIISGDSVFDIYAKNVKTSVTFKTIVINDRLKSWERINTNISQTVNDFSSNHSNDGKDFNSDNIEKSLSISATNSVSNSIQSLNLISNESKQTINDFLDIEEFNYYDLMKIDSNIIENIRLFCVFQRGNSLIFVTKEDRAYGMGFNRSGGLGLGHQMENIHKPELNTTLSGRQLIDIVFGFEHCLGLTATGECYSWGQNRYGQLGIGSYDCPKFPQKINEFNDKTIVKISCGAYHSMALTSDGEVYSWGHNTFAQLGDKSYNSRVSPTQVLIRDKVVSISCGTNHTIALTINGNVYVWGCNETGQLGRPKERDYRENRLKAMCNRPQKIPGFEGTSIIKAVCGPHYSLLLTIDGFVYAFGENGCGQIGNGTTDNQFTVFQCNHKIKIKEIFTHWENDLSIAVSEDNKIYVWGLAKMQKILKPKLIQNSYGKSLFDIYVKLAKNKVTFKSLNINKDIIDLNQINNNFIQSNNLSNNDINKEFNESNISSNYNSTENLNDFNENFDNNYIYEYNEDIEEEFDDKNSAQIIDNFSQSSNSDISANNQNLDLIFGKVFLKHLNQSFNNPNNSDLKLIAENNVIYCHKTILKLRNEKFWLILSQNMSENNEIRINPRTYQSFYAFIQYMYGIEPQMCVQYIDDLRKMAKYFEEPNIEDLCEQHIQQLIESIDKTNICALYEISINYDLNDLENYCIEFVSNNWKDILKSESFLSLNNSLSKRLMTSISNQNN